MSANDTTKSEPTITDEMTAKYSKGARATTKRLVLAVTAKGREYLDACLTAGRHIDVEFAKLIDSGMSKDAAATIILTALNEDCKTQFTWGYVETWGKGAKGYDSLRANQRVFNSLDVYVKLGSLDEEAEGQPSRVEFTDQLIAAGITAEAAVRKAVTAEKKRRKGTPDNERTKIRKQSGKVAERAGKSVNRLAKTLTSGPAAFLFLEGAKWAAGEITAQPGFDVKAYRDGFSEALEDLVKQDSKVAEAQASETQAKVTKAKATK